jgi:hypothetical protein
MKTLITKWLRYSVLRKGGKSSLWTLVGVLGFLNSARKRFGGPQRVSVLSDGIRPGEVIEIRHTGQAAKPVRKERAKKAALLAQLQAADVTAKGRPGRQARKLHRKLSGSVIAEMASSTRPSSATTAPVTDLLGAAAMVFGAIEKPFSRRVQRKAVAAAKKQSKAAVRSAKGRR